MRKVFLQIVSPFLLLISLASLAYFDDFEKILKNKFLSGILDLKISKKENINFEAQNLLPGDEFEKEFEIENQGSLPAKSLTFSLDSNFSEGSFFDQELIKGKIKNFPWIANHPVISEIQISGKGEWIEIYNPTAEEIDLSNWYFGYFPAESKDWKNPSRKAKLVSGEISSILPFSFFLFRISGEVLEADGDAGYQGETDSLSDFAGTVAIFKGEISEENLVDAIGWGSVFLKEGKPTLIPSANQSLERKSGGKHQEDKGNGFDTSNNFRDFFIREFPEPQNFSSEPEFPF